MTGSICGNEAAFIETLAIQKGCILEKPWSRFMKAGLLWHWKQSRERVRIERCRNACGVSGIFGAGTVCEI